ncbi:hypothetical protein BU23DRAFT_124155 [Bimuria novae-zelandiae CBS 107.79]|uniref:Uncharacterized protein n=1 Tax=Bimuria novae-zelandiae CBS 107.79 TaxID=1447943 RepID=A0A6A5V9I8_9PLEO|nr:hypothetical protein BU23DRAFT_124155 [Bimuria novae-zelandiae CBS 107.79]
MRTSITSVLIKRLSLYLFLHYFSTQTTPSQSASRNTSTMALADHLRPSVVNTISTLGNLSTPQPPSIDSRVGAGRSWPVRVRRFIDGFHAKALEIHDRDGPATRISFKNASPPLHFFVRTFAIGYLLLATRAWLMNRHPHRVRDAVLTIFCLDVVMCTITGIVKASPLLLFATSICGIVYWVLAALG